MFNFQINDGKNEYLQRETMNDLYKEIYMQKIKNVKTNKHETWQDKQWKKQKKTKQKLKLRYPVQVSLFLTGLCTPLNK